MKKFCLFLSLFIQIAGYINISASAKTANHPDSVYLFSYATDKNSNHNGLHFAWSANQENWQSIGPEYRFLFSDYGRWGSEKRMIKPYLFHDQQGLWHCIWSVNEKHGTFAHASSSDLIHWKPQSYPIVIENNNCLEPEVSYIVSANSYIISWLSNATGKTQAYFVTTSDFKSYNPARSLDISSRLNLRKQVTISGNTETGTMHKVPWKLVEDLINNYQANINRELLWSENFQTDKTRFATLQPVDATITVEETKRKTISDLLIGVFFEDINYAADGGLYAEMIQNRDFEYNLSDKEGNDKTWDNFKAWDIIGGNAAFSIDSLSPVHQNNVHYAVLKTTAVGAGIVNEGFDGITLKSGEKYNFSIFARNGDKQNKILTIRLIGKNGEIYGESGVNVSSAVWKKYETVLTVNQSVSNARLEIIPQQAGTIAMDMISLFPQSTFKGHKNGLRADLAQTIADIHPRFVRFPGGCVSHGDGLGNIYRWKNTIGPMEARKPQRNLWGYHQTAGLGYFEYFQFCEDIGATPLPVIAAGVPCQNSATGGAGQQGGIPMCDMNSYVQDILDLIEWANGDAKTTWGKKRADAGHPKPFNLKYIGIGNEDLMTDIFEQRFTMIVKALKEKHPEITVIGTVGPSFEGSDYDEGWRIAAKTGVPMVDEHYYQSTGWFIHNQDFYDNYDRTKPKVYLGEYASWGSTLYNALSEALYLTSIERNGDMVRMTSYAPLLAKEGNTQWNPDLIYFNKTEVKPTVNYSVQQLYGQHGGNEYFPSTITLSDKSDAVKKRIAVSVVRDNSTKDIIVKMVNLLPQSVNARINLSGFTGFNPLATRILLTGIPDDKLAKPVIDTVTVSHDFQCALPDYSFTVIRIKME